MGNLALTDNNQIQSYFSKIFALKSEGKDFPIDLDDVWSLCYTRKSVAIKALSDNESFIQDFDYQVLHQNMQNPKGGRPKIKYMLTVQCLEYFIVKKVRPVFEVYRQVFHKTAEISIAPPKNFVLNSDFSKLQKDVEILQARLNNQAFALSYANQIETDHVPISKKEVLDLAQGLADMNNMNRGECLSKIYRLFYREHGVNLYNRPAEYETIIEYCEQKGYLGLIKEIIKSQMINEFV